MKEYDTPTSNIEDKMKQDSLDRDRIMEEVTKNLDVHSRKMFEYDRKAKTLDLLAVKYKSLKRESEETIAVLQKKLALLTEENKNLENEVMILRKTAVSMKGKMTGMRSALELVIADFGMDQIELATGLDKEKLQAYLEK